MPEINLLQNQIKDTTHTSSRRTKVVVWLCLFILILIAAAGTLLYLNTKTIQTQINDLTIQNNKIQQQVSGQQSGLAEAQAYQAKLSNVDLLLKNHLAFTPLFAEFEKYTYLRAQFVNVDIAEQTGKVHLEGIVDSYNGLGKLLLGLSTSSHFHDVNLLTVLRSGDPAGGYTFSVEMTANSDLFSKK